MTTGLSERSTMGQAVPPRSVCTGLLGMAAAGATLLFFFDPSTAGFYPSCPFHALTGLYCPGCGTCRALHALLHGNVAEAFWFNPLTVLALPLLIYLLAPYVAFGLGARKVSVASVPARYTWVLLWTILAYWVLRNVPYYPFTLLAP